MAFAREITITRELTVTAGGLPVRAGEAGGVAVSVTYLLEHGDDDLASVAASLVGEVVRASAVCRAHCTACTAGPRIPGTPPTPPEEEASEDGEDNPFAIGEEDDAETDGDTDDGDEDGEAAEGRGGYSYPVLPAPRVPATAAVPPEDLISVPKRLAIESLVRQVGLSPEALLSLLREQFDTWNLRRLTKAQAHDLHVALQRSLQEKTDAEQEDRGREIGSMIAAPAPFAAPSRPAQGDNHASPNGTAGVPARR